MKDLINRQTVMNAFAEYVRRSNNSDFAPTPTWNDAVEIVENLPSAEEESFEWCTDCKEYDQKAHCCHRWTKVIRNTVQEVMNERWIPVSEKLPEDLVGVLVDDDGTTAIGYCERYWDDDGKTCIEWHDLLHYRIDPHYWMPLPEPYKDGETV